MTVSASCRRWGLVAAALFLFATPLVWGRMNGTVDTWILPVGCLIALLAWLGYPDRFQAARGVRVTWLLGVFFLVLSTISSLQSVYPRMSLQELSRVIGIGLIGWSFSFILSEPWRARVLNYALLFGAGVSGWVGIGQYIAAHDPRWRTFSTFYNPNAFAGFLVVVLPGAAALLMTETRRSLRIAGAVAILLAFGGLVLTGSKGGLLAFAVSAVSLALMVRRARRHPWRFNLATVGIALVVVCVIAFTARPVVTRLRTMTGSQQNSMLHRWLTYRGTVDMVRARPLLGTGPGTFQYAYPPFARASFTRMAHNNYLQVAAETGLPAALFFTSFWICAAVIAWNRDSGEVERLQAAGAVAGMIAFLVHGLVDYTYYISAVAVAAMFVVGLVLRNDSAALPSRCVSAAGRCRWVTLILGLGLVGGFTVSYRWTWADLYAGDAETLGKRGDFSGAIRGYRRAVNLDPLHAHYHLQLADLLAAKAEVTGEWDEAFRHYARAAKLAPTYAGAPYRWGRALRAAGRNREAAQRFRQAIRCDPNFTGAWMALGDLYLDRDDTAGRRAAARCYRRVVAISESPVARVTALENAADIRYAVANLRLGVLELLNRRCSAAERYLAAGLHWVDQLRVQDRAYGQVGAASGWSFVPPPKEIDAVELEITATRSRAAWICGDEQRAVHSLVEYLQQHPDADLSLQSMVPSELWEKVSAEWLSTGS